MCLFKIKGEGESKLLQLFSGSEKPSATEILITVWLSIKILFSQLTVPLKPFLFSGVYSYISLNCMNIMSFKWKALPVYTPIYPTHMIIESTDGVIP